MSTLLELKGRLQVVVERISDHAHVVWRDERAPFVADGVIVRLHLRSVQGVGTPEPREREDLDDVGAEIKTDIVEQKTATLSILVECFDQVVTAHTLLEKMRTRFWRPWALTRLREVDCAVLRSDPTQDLPTSYDNRVWSAAAFDLRLGWVTVDTQEGFDESAEDGDETDASPYIETVILNDGIANEQRISLIPESP
jgi:hypothetical protein